MIHFDQEKLDRLNNIYKINLINSCSGYKPANLIATISKMVWKMLQYLAQ